MTATVPGTVPEGCTIVDVIGPVIVLAPEYSNVVVTKTPGGVVTGGGVIIAIVPGVVPVGSTRVLVIGAVMVPVPEY